MEQLIFLFRSFFRSTKYALRCTFFLLIFIPSLHAELENFQAADVVLGQPGFTSNAANNGNASPSANTLNTPLGVFSDGKRLFVGDTTNRRVLIWNSIPTTNFTPANVVLGQPDFSQSTANNGGVSARSFAGPSNVFSDGKRLFVADQTNRRVMIWNTIPTTNFAPADVVLGQPDFSQNTANNGGVSASSLNVPIGIFSDGKRLFIGDNTNRRVLIWNKIPTTNFAPADVVLGQPDFTQNAINNGGISARSFSNSSEVFSDGKKLFVGDNGNSRILIWNSIPTTSFASADVVIGQPDFSQNIANNGGVSARSLSNPRNIFSDGKRFFVSDSSNNRILIWSHIPTINFEPADIVLGQPDFTQNTVNNGGVSASSLNAPVGLFLDGKRLFVSDRTNNRVLIFNVASFKPSLDPQFEQGKAVVGKVFNDINGNGIQDSPQTTDDRPQKKKKKEKDHGLSTMDYGLEKGIEGVKVVSDTGIYAITDQDGKYHFPYLETGQHVLKIDPDTLPEGATITTDNPYKVTITKGILTKVSFGVKIPESVNVGATPRVRPLDSGQAQGPAPTTKEALHLLSSTLNLNLQPLLQVTITQDTSSKPVKELGITAEIISAPKGQSPKDGDSPLIRFTTTCNYFLFVKESEIRLYTDQKQKRGTDYNLSPFSILKLPHPVPLYYEIPLQDILPKVGAIHESPLHLYYQLIVRDGQGHEDRTSVGRVEIK